MKKILLTLLLACSSVFAQTNYNSIATAYVTTTISQNVVFNSAMQAGGTFTLSVLAHNGGGRPNEKDTANVRIQFYAAGGTLLSSVNSNYSANLPNPNGAPGNPWADPSVPWTTLSVSSTNCGGSCSNVAYATVSMYGIDASFWAGDYGPWYRAPTFQQNGGGNLLYNPEFGPAYGYNAQGWTTNPGMGACQGAWGGSNPCIVNSNGTPGSSTVGLVANENGGGPSSSGGTTSGTAGGYNSTMSVTNAGPGTGTPQSPPPPAQPVVSMKPIYNTSTNLYINTITPTSYNSPYGEGAAQAFDNNPYTKYLNFDKANAGVTIKLNQGRVVSGFKLTTANDFSGRDPTSYKLYASNDGKTWTKLGEGALSLSENRFAISDMITVTNTQPYFYYFIYFPTTKSGQGCGLNCDSMQIGDITYYYDENNTTSSVDATPSGGTVSNPGQAGSVCSDCAPSWPATSEITVNQNTQKSAAKGRVANITLGNTLYLEQKIGSSGNAVTIEQTGFYNKIAGLGGGTYAIVDGDNNTVNIKQGDTTGKNLIEFNIVGNTNTITMWQSRSPTTGLRDGSESGGHYMGLNIAGNTNTVTLKQSNDGGATSGHFAYVDISGNTNNATLKQSGNGEKTFFGIVNGSSNVFDVAQQGSGSYLDLSLAGNGHNVTANQKDSGSHKATINLTNAGAASTVTLVQQGSTAQNINITQQCATLGGCSVSVTQGTGP
jgi:hypothetical protein